MEKDVCKNCRYWSQIPMSQTLVRMGNCVEEPNEVIQTEPEESCNYFAEKTEDD